jgi:hypothetical protein
MLGKASENPRNFFLLGKATRTKSSYETNILLDKASTQQILVQKSTHELLLGKASTQQIFVRNQPFTRQS